MTLFFGILTFFVVLAVLILVHELGHFGFAKLFGVRVDEFGLGFPPRLKVWRRGGTLYSLNAIPLGGFVRMLGENGEAQQPDSFGAKPPWQRFIILVAGPSMNLLLALAIFFLTFILGFPDGLTSITQISPRSPAAAAGLQPGDRVIALNGKSVGYRSDLQIAIVTAVETTPGKPVTLRVLRGANLLKISLVPRVHPPLNQGAVGIGLGKTTTIKYGPEAAAQHAGESVVAMVATLPQLFTAVSRHGTGDIAGPIGIAHYTTVTVGAAPQDGPSPLLKLIALLSANLGVLNLLPIPALDGGRIVFVLISWVRRRNLDPQVEGIIHMVGMALLLLLIVVISYQDVVRWIGGGSS